MQRRSCAGSPTGSGANGVGPIALSLQLRADVVTPAVADALVAVGLVRAYVGVDGYSRPQLARLGRNAPADAGARAIALLAARGVFAVCNALLVGPTIPLESIRAELEGMRAIRGAPLHLLPIDVRAGTTYHARAERRGLVEGGFLWRRYRFEDPRTAVLAEVITGLPSRLEEHSVPLALYDLAYNLGVARRLIPALPLAREAQTYARVSDAWNADQLRILEAAVRIASDGDLAAARRFLAEEEPRVRRFDRGLMDETEEACAPSRRPSARAGTAGAGSHPRPAAVGGRVLDGARGLQPAAATRRTGAGTRTSVDRGRQSTSVRYDWHWSAPEVPSRTRPAEPVRPTRISIRRRHLLRPVRERPVTARFDTEGRLVAIDGVDGGTLAPDVVACLLGSFSGYCYPNLAGTTQTLTGHCWIA